MKSQVSALLEISSLNNVQGVSECLGKKHVHSIAIYSFIYVELIFYVLLTLCSFVIQNPK